jgi:hypothetical protein
MRYAILIGYSVVLLFLMLHVFLSGYNIGHHDGYQTGAFDALTVKGE